MRCVLFMLDWSAYSPSAVEVMRMINPSERDISITRRVTSMSIVAESFW